MEWAQAWLLTFVASVVATVYLLWTARAGSSRQAQVVQDHPADDSLGKRAKVCLSSGQRIKLHSNAVQHQTRKRFTIVYPDQTRDAVDNTEVEYVFEKNSKKKKGNVDLIIAASLPCMALGQTLTGLGCARMARSMLTGFETLICYQRKYPRQEL